MVAALDAIAQFRATKEPLKKVVRRLQVQRKLGSRDRAKMSEAVFAWSRADHTHSEGQRLSQRQKDEAIILRVLAEGPSEGSFPTWFAERLTNAYGDEAKEILASLHTRAGPTLAIDTRFATVETVTAALDALALQYEVSTQPKGAVRILQGKFRVESLPKALQRHVWMMDESSQYAASLLQPNSEQWVLDYCAGGGGKTRYLVSRNANVVAMDISEKRLLDARERCHGDKVVFVVADGIKPPFAENSFDWILLDAPCTGTGTIRRAPDLLMRLKETDITRFSALQRELLKSAYGLLKANGTLVYATCSILPEENQEQVDWAVKTLGCSLLSSVQLLPSRDQSDGFFAAGIQKKGA